MVKITKKENKKNPDEKVKEPEAEKKKRPKLTKKQMKLKRTKRSMLSKMYMRHLRKIAKEKGIKSARTKIKMVEKLTRELDMDDVRHYYSEVFGTEEFDVLKHELVPPHRILPPEEREELKKKYNLATLKQLPKMKVSDPAVIAIGGVIGDVVEITRQSSTAKETKYYRLVVR